MSDWETTLRKAIELLDEVFEKHRSDHAAIITRTQQLIEDSIREVEDELLDRYSDGRADGYSDGYDAGIETMESEWP